MKSQMTRVLASLPVLILLVICLPQFASAQERIKPRPHPFDTPQHAPRADFHSFPVTRRR